MIAGVRISCCRRAHPRPPLAGRAPPAPPPPNCRARLASTKLAGPGHKDATGRNACGFGNLGSYFERFYGALPSAQVGRRGSGACTASAYPLLLLSLLPLLPASPA